jgi:hypothetical protein
MGYTVTDNFLELDKFTFLQKSLLEGENFPWYYNDFILYGDDKSKIQFTHTFFLNGDINSGLFDLLIPVLDLIKPTKLLRVKANLGHKTYEHEIGGYHTDTNEPCKTAVLYMNTNNGYTMFKDGTKIVSLENRFIEFDSDMEHTGVSQTDTQVRCLINFNYLK